MRLNRGCGCMLLLLAFANLALVVGSIVSLAGGSENAGRDVLAIVVFGANLVAALLLGIAAFRRLPIGAPTRVQEGTGLSSEDEGSAGEGGREDEGSEEEMEEE